MIHGYSKQKNLAVSNVVTWALSTQRNTNMECARFFSQVFLFLILDFQCEKTETIIEFSSISTSYPLFMNQRIFRFSFLPCTVHDLILFNTCTIQSILSSLLCLNHSYIRTNWINSQLLGHTKNESNCKFMKNTYQQHSGVKLSSVNFIFVIISSEITRIWKREKIWSSVLHYNFCTHSAINSFGRLRNRSEWFSSNLDSFHSNLFKFQVATAVHK